MAVMRSPAFNPALDEVLSQDRDNGRSGCQDGDAVGRIFLTEFVSERTQSIRISIRNFHRQYIYIFDFLNIFKLFAKLLNEQFSFRIPVNCFFNKRIFFLQTLHFLQHFTQGRFQRRSGLLQHLKSSRNQFICAATRDRFDASHARCG